jgi:hypothetical protein
MVAHGLCKPEVGVRSPVGPPILSMFFKNVSCLAVHLRCTIGAYEKGMTEVRNRQLFGVEASMVMQRAVTPWLRQVGSIPTHSTKFGVKALIQS